MKQLTVNGQRVLIDEQDEQLTNKHRWYVRKGYLFTVIHGKTYSLHRLLLDAGDLVIDHINGDTLDNRRSNLRVCTREENQRNRGKASSNTSGYKGVTLDGSRYKAYLKCRGTHYNLGRYTSKHASAIVYNVLARELHGRFFNGNTIGTLHQLYYPELVH